MSHDELVAAGVAAARAGGEILLANWRRLPSGSVAEKQKNDFVTSADRESEARIVAKIRERFPRDAFLGEEGGASGNAAAERTWIIDPLDGTSNFISGFPFWCVSVAAKARRSWPASSGIRFATSSTRRGEAAARSATAPESG